MRGRGGGEKGEEKGERERTGKVRVESTSGMSVSGHSQWEE